MTEEMNSENKGSKDGLALVVGGLFVLGLVFATYTYFNKAGTNTTSLKDIISSNTKRESAGNTVENAAGNTVKNEQVTTSGENAKTGNEESKPSVFGELSVVWTANDYKYGDIKGSSYTVKSGDTLWEIAEAVYGNGADWTKILQANLSNIGYLPNGRQALIVPGQTLVLP